MMMMMMMMMIIMIMMMLMMIIIITIITALKGANLLIAPRTASNTYAQAARVQSYANHAQYIELLSRATCCVPRGRKGQLSC